MKNARTSLLGSALYRSRKAFASVGMFSLFINLAMLNGPLFMLQVYDRVLTSQSRETLFFLTVLAVGILAFQAMVEVARSELLIRAGAQLDNELSGKTFGLSRDGASKDRQMTATQGLRDLDTVRMFSVRPRPDRAVRRAVDADLSVHRVSASPAARGSWPWPARWSFWRSPISSEVSTRGALTEAATANRDSEYFVGTLHNNSESARAMGMVDNLQRRWQEHHQASLAWQSIASDRAARLSSAAKLARQALQIFSLGLGAWLALNNEISGRRDRRRVDHHGPRAAADRGHDRPMEELRSNARQAYARLSAALARRKPSGSAHRACRRPTVLFKLEDVWYALRRREGAGPARRLVRIEGGRSAGRHRPDGFGQVDAGAADDRRRGSRRRAACVWTASKCPTGRRARSVRISAISRKTSS